MSAEVDGVMMMSDPNLFNGYWAGRDLYDASKEKPLRCSCYTECEKSLGVGGRLVMTPFGYLGPHARGGLADSAGTLAIVGLNQNDGRELQDAASTGGTELMNVCAADYERGNPSMFLGVMVPFLRAVTSAADAMGAFNRLAFCNAVKCAPNTGDASGPSGTMLKNCSGKRYAVEELGFVGPDVALALGRDGFASLTLPPAGLKGVVMHSGEWSRAECAGKTVDVFRILHPSGVLRGPNVSAWRHALGGFPTPIHQAEGPVEWDRDRTLMGPNRRLFREYNLLLLGLWDFWRRNRAAGSSQGTE